MTNIAISNMVGVAATAVVIGYSGFGEPIPQSSFSYDSNEPIQFYQSGSDYYRLSNSDSIALSEQIETLKQFSSSILNNIKDIEPEYTELVDEKFWDLI